MTVAMYLSQQHGRRGQIIDTRKPESGILFNLTYGGSSLLFLLAREFDGFRSISLLVESKVSLSSCLVLVSLFR